MKSIALFLLAFTTLTLNSCEKETIAPATTGSTPELLALPPLPPCVTTQFELQNSSGSLVGIPPLTNFDYGYAELSFDGSDNWFFTNLGSGWYSSEYWIYDGPQGSAPVDVNGNLDLAQFEHIILTPSRNFFSYQRSIPTNSPVCNHFVVAIKVNRINAFQQPVNPQMVYFSGNAFANGFEFEHCADPCVPQDLVCGNGAIIPN